MRKRSLYPIRGVIALSVSCLLCALFGCSPLAKDARRGDFGEVQWYVREVTKGEIVPVEGAHKHFEVFEQPTPIRVEGGASNSHLTCLMAGEGRWFSWSVVKVRWQ